MSITLMEMLYYFPKLKYIALIGIAAGSNSTTQQFGDLLIPTNVYNYEMGKYAEDRVSGKTIFQSNYSVFNIDEDILQKISAVTRDHELLERIRRKWKDPKSYPLRAHTDNFACGSAVVASADKVKEIEAAIARKYIGLDMESYALASVNQLKSNRFPKLFVIKAISDFADALLYRKLFNPTDYKRIRQIFELFSFNADAGLTLKLRKVEKILNKAEFLKIYSMPEGTLNLNKALRVDAGHPRFSELSDPVYEKVLGVEGDFYEDSVDILTDSYGKVVAEIEYAYTEFKQFVVYAFVRCRQEGKKDNVEKWIGFKNEVFDISKEPNQFEKALPVEAKDVFGDWKKVSVDLRAAVNLLFGNEKIEYVNLIKMRVRGAGKLAYVFLREA